MRKSQTCLENKTNPIIITITQNKERTGQNQSHQFRYKLF